MKQVLQNISNGETLIEEVPCPESKKGNVLIETSTSLISAGTERMLIDFGKSGWIEKARSQPDKVKMVLDKIKTEGLSSTYDAVKSKLDQPLALGYCNVGKVIDPSDTSFKNGDRVVSNGNHAEIVRVPNNLVVHVPDKVDDDTASFTVIGAIALQGIRLISPNVGENVVVVGLGLIGLMAVQILRANGCNVLAIDFDSSKCELARKFGAETVDLSKKQDPISISNSFSKGKGADAVLITASSKSNDVMHQAATMSRKRGKIILVGVVGLDLSRDDFYEKELTFQVSCSYGPGRYDERYEEHGIDYPYEYVRWTEKRNFEAILNLMESGLLDVKLLISHKYNFDDSIEAYKKLEDKSSLGILLKYKNSQNEEKMQSNINLKNNVKISNDQGVIAFIGGGNYASRILIPAFKKANADLDTIVTDKGLSAVHHGKRNGFRNAATDVNEAFKDDVDTVVIATRHNLHANQIIQSLKKNKNVFVEKPLALKHKEIDEIEKVYKESEKKLMVGFNRRFSPQIKKMKYLLDAKSKPKTFVMTMNAGYISPDHWTQNKEIGGGRIIGEACHYIDLMRFLAGSRIISFTAKKMSDASENKIFDDNCSISLVFNDGSMGTIHYFANGNKSFPKERVEVFCDGSILKLDNFKKLKGYGWSGFSSMNLWRQDKGQSRCVQEFIESVNNQSDSPIPSNEIFEVARITLDISDALNKQ
ncbi:bi-domain-containing oxidoreductase [Gammaproteobacteria bacterium]|nr:bi-domain-containing oxidoreductase [Gammaproteobacteria bacterium]